MDRCPNCAGDHKCLPPDGPEHAEYLFIGEAPGFFEEKSGTVFCGRTGQEVNSHYLPLAGLRREHVRFTNCIRCLPPGAKGKLDLKRERDRELLKSCAGHHLYPELRRNHYKLIVPLGAFACYAIDPEINLELHHGMPLETQWGLVFPQYHPSQGLHEPKKMLLIRTDWARLRKYIRHTLKLPVDKFPTPDYREAEDDDFSTFHVDPYQPLACDTESTRSREPFCLTFTDYAGCGRLIRAGRSDLLQAFQETLDIWRGPILFHNWMYDCHVVERMGLRFPRRLIKDTMVLAYHLGNLPQGLKALAYRELGMLMQSFDDLVTPHSTPLALSYLREAYSQEFPKPDEQLVRSPEGDWKTYKPQSISTRIKRFLTAYGKDPTKDVFEAWGNWEGDHLQVESVCGPWTGKCITHVPFDQVLHYACRDADATFRLWPILDRMRRRVRKGPQEDWGG